MLVLGQMIHFASTRNLISQGLKTLIYNFLKHHTIYGFLKHHTCQTYLWAKLCLGPPSASSALDLHLLVSSFPIPKFRGQLLVSPLLGLERVELKLSRFCQKHTTESNHEETAGKPKWKTVLQMARRGMQKSQGHEHQRSCANGTGERRLESPDNSMPCLILAWLLDQAKKMAIKGLIGPIGKIWIWLYLM